MKLNEAFPDWYETAYIFRKMEQTDFPWADENLALDYFGNHSGEKLISPLIRAALKKEDVTEVNNVIETTLYNILVKKYGNKWARIWEALTAEYDPLQNYDMTEVETPDLTDTETPDITRVETPDIRREHDADKNTQLSTTVSGSTTTDAYGFNSAAPVGVGEGGAESTETVSGDSDHNTEHYIDTETGTRTHTETGSRTTTHTGERTLTRSGNIGVTTSQQMLEAEFEVRKYNFFETVYQDFDEVLTINKYESGV